MTTPPASASRVLAIDVFRGIIIFTMVFVNELAGITDVPRWMKHLPANADAMTFVDLVFPAFLFIVGMSIPFALQARARKGETPLSIWRHIALRSLGLVVIGVYMVNAEDGFEQAAMSISLPLWTLLMFSSVLLIWSNYSKQLAPWVVHSGKLLGVLGLVTLWWLYKGPENSGMTTQWWGILGLIGWAYFMAASLFLVARQLASAKRALASLVFFALLLLGLFFALDKTVLATIPGLDILADNNRNNTHALLVIAGIILSQLFYAPEFATRKLKHYGIFVATAGFLALATWQFSPISKIWATPSWGLLSVFFCSLIFGLIYWLVDIKQQRRWTRLFEPSATNPLLVYLLPYILLAACEVLGVQLRPAFFAAGLAGIGWSLGFACAIMLIGALLTRLGLRVKL